MWALLRKYWHVLFSLKLPCILLLLPYPFQQVKVWLFSGFLHALNVSFFFIFTEKFQRVTAQGQHWWFIFLPFLVSSIVVVTGIFPFAFTWGSLTHITGRCEFYTNSVLLLIHDQRNQLDALCWIQVASGGGFLKLVIILSRITHEQSCLLLLLNQQVLHSVGYSPFVTSKCKCKQLITCYLCLCALPLVTQRLGCFLRFCFDISGSSHGPSSVLTQG